jgi:hypothetical protein
VFEISIPPLIVREYTLGMRNAGLDQAKVARLGMLVSFEVASVISSLLLYLRPECLNSAGQRFLHSDRNRRSWPSRTGQVVLTPVGIGVVSSNIVPLDARTQRAVTRGAFARNLQRGVRWLSQFVLPVVPLENH